MKCFLTLILILLAGYLPAQDRIVPEHLTIKDGLANNSVRTIIQDKDGFLWFGTLNGLSRYDGQRFENFYYVPSDPSSISNNKIRDMFQDGAGYIWVSTYDDLVHRYDPRTDHFSNFPTDLAERYTDNAIHFMYESSPGVVWLYLSGNGLLRIESSPETADYNYAWFNEDNLLESNNITFLKKSRNGGLWIGSDAGFAKFADDRITPTDSDQCVHFFPDRKFEVSQIYENQTATYIGCNSGEFFQLKNDSLRLVAKSNHRNSNFNQFSFIREGKNGIIYGGTRNGIMTYDPKTEKTDHITANKSELITNYITNCYVDHYGDFWLITSLRGVIRFQPEKNKFTHYSLQPETRLSITEGEKQIFVEDNNKRLWVGIYGGGISRFDREKEQFVQYLHEDNNPASLSSNLVLSMFQDQSGNLWAGTYKQGLNKINLEANHFHNGSNQNLSNTDILNEVRAVFEDSRQWIWAGDKRGDIVVYNQQFKPLFRLNDLLGDEKITSGIYCLEEDAKGNIWIGTKGSGIYVLCDLPKNSQQIPRSPRVVRYTRNNSQNAITRNDVFDLHFDQLGQMWAALYHGGVNLIRNPLEDDQEILFYLHNDEDRFSITDNRVRCFLEDLEGNMWIGTSNGLNFLSSDYQDNDNKKFFHIEQDGSGGSLSYNDIINIFQDSNHDIWIGTYGGGINRLVEKTDNQTFRFEQITMKNGLSSNLVLGFVEDSHKNLWISTDFGMCKYNLINKKIETFYESDGMTENSFSEGEGIRTSQGAVVFGHLSGFQWFWPGKIKKQERMVPVVLTDLQINNQTNKELLQQARLDIREGDHTIELKHNQNFVTFEFAALDFKAPSKIQYEFKLENYEDNWNKSGNLNKAIYRELHPGDYLFRLKASNSDGLWVNPEMRIHLSVLPPFWLTGWAYLLYFLVAAAIFILARKFTLERIKLKHEVEFEKQLADDKLKFYTSISHEFKTPLALILGPVEDILADKATPEQTRKPLLMVKRNTRRLLELIEQLMDFRKIQKGVLKNEQTPGNLVYFLNEIFMAFKPLAEKKEIEFTFHKSCEQLDASIDYKSLEKVLFNLLSNAFKHTADGQKISLSLSIDSDSNTAKIRVSDEGEGIREQDIPHLFERFSLGKKSRWKDESGTGIGLSFTKELVDLMNGTIEVQSELGRGSCFTVSVPFIQIDSPAAVTQELSYTNQFLTIEEENESPEPVLEPNGKGQLKKQTILVVEDNPDLRSWLSTQLGQKYKVLQAENGLQGVEKAKAEDPEIIICDVMMPEMDGLELTRILKSEFHTSHIPIVLLTAKSLEEHKIEGIEIGADDYITKPFNMVYLQKRIENILKQRKQLKERFGRDLQAAAEDLGQSTADQEFMAKVCELVEEQMTDPDFSIDSLLPHFSFGRTIFYKKMKAISGYSPKDFVRIVRMKSAGRLLKDPQITVSEVSFKVGFNDANYFSRQFKKHFGENPSDYQKRHKPAPQIN